MIDMKNGIKNCLPSAAGAILILAGVVIGNVRPLTEIFGDAEVLDPEMISKKQWVQLDPNNLQPGLNFVDPKSNPNFYKLNHYCDHN